jgi:Flp pilus assembly protein TadD
VTPASLPRLLGPQHRARAATHICDEMSVEKAPDMAIERLRYWNELGRALAQRGRHEEALECYDRALTVRNDIPQIWANRGNALRHLGRLTEAEKSLREALRLKPHFANAYNNLGSVLLDLNRIEEADSSFRSAIHLKPGNPGFHKNLAYVSMRAGRAAEAQAHYRAALCLIPDDAEIHEDLGMALLLSGKFREGWAEYEWRWRTRRAAVEARRFPLPAWGGERIGDKTVLVHAEQGLGDTLQFCRLASHVPARDIILEVQRPLVRLLSTLPGPRMVIARGETLPPHDLHCSIMSLPYALETTVHTIPAEIPYLRPDPRDVDHWRRRLTELPGLRVGLCWAGGRSPTNGEQNRDDDRRSLHLTALAPFAAIEGISFVSLQTGPPAAQAMQPPGGMNLHDFTAALHDFADTAALIECLDLIISTDTATPHLAGALGKPVWLMIRADACFRWLQDRDDSPWYPTMRLFRQPAPGDWGSVISRVRDALRHVGA